MTKLSLCVLSASLLFSGAAFSAFADEAPAGAQTAPPPPNQIAQSNVRKDAHDPNKMICKALETTGSRLGGERSCHTRAEWDRIAHDEQAGWLTPGQRLSAPGMGK